MGIFGKKPVQKKSNQEGSYFEELSMALWLSGASEEDIFKFQESLESAHQRNEPGKFGFNEVIGKNNFPGIRDEIRRFNDEWRRDHPNETIPNPLDKSHAADLQTFAESLGGVIRQHLGGGEKRG